VRGMLRHEQSAGTDSSPRPWTQPRSPAEPSRITPEPFAVAPAAADYAQASAGLVLFCVAVLERLELLADTLRRRFKRSPGEAE